MKKLTLILLFLFVLVGCSQTPKEDPSELEKPKTVAKIDESKDYVYVEKNDGLSFKDIIIESMPDFYKDLVEELGNNKEYAKLSSDKIFVNERIVINIDSEEAKALQKTLDEEYEKLVETRELALKENADGEEYMALSTNILYDFEASESMIYLSIYRGNLVTFSDASTTVVDTYVFDIKDGNKLSNDQILENAGVTLADIEKYIKDDFEGNPVVDDYGTFTRVLIGKEESFDNSKENQEGKIFYEINATRLIAISDTEVHVPLDAFSMLNGDFVPSAIITIPLSALK